jgi:hypothetical protein
MGNRIVLAGPDNAGAVQVPAPGLKVVEQLSMPV